MLHESDPASGWMILRIAESFGLLAAVIIGIWLLLLAHILVHELGHAFAGWACDMRVMRMRVGPLTWLFGQRKLRRERGARALVSGATHFLLRRSAQLPRAAIVVLAGPLATLALAIALAVAASLAPSGEPWQVFLAVNLLWALAMFIGNLVPLGPVGELHDGKNLLALLGQDPATVGRWRMTALTGVAVDGRWMRDSGVSLADALAWATPARCEKEPANVLPIALYALQERVDEPAEEMLRTMVEKVKVPLTWLGARGHLFVFVALVRRDPAAARELLQRAPPSSSSSSPRPTASPPPPPPGKSTSRTQSLFDAALLIADGRTSDARALYDAHRSEPLDGFLLWIDARLQEALSEPAAISSVTATS